MTGSRVSLRVSELADQYDAILVADEAHSIGVLGTDGSGVFRHDGIAGPDCKKVLVHPCGKALAAGGAVVTLSLIHI